MSVPFFTSDIGRQYTVANKLGAIAGGAADTLLNLTAGRGFIKSMFIAVGGADWLSRERSLVKVTINGESTPCLVATLANLHCADYAPNLPFFSRWMGYNSATVNNATYNALTGSAVVGGGTELGFQNCYAIPFASGVKVELENGSPSSAMSYAMTIGYYLPPLFHDFRRRARLANSEQRLGVAPYTEQDLVNISGRGVLFGTFLLTDSGNKGFSHLEGPIRVYVDGETTPSFESSGTEDYFGQSLYFQSGCVNGPSLGCTRYYPGGIAGAYRFHDEDPIEFDTALRVSWTCGVAAVHPFIYTTYLSSNVLYYLDR